MIRVENISRHFSQLPEIKRLYQSSFPKNEREPFNGLVSHPSNLDFKACFDGETLVGLYAILNEGDISHILFLSVEENERDHGYGSQILQEIIAAYPSQRILVDIEDPEKLTDKPSDKHPEKLSEQFADKLAIRLRRKHFYLQNGFQPTDIHYVWRGTPYQILIINGTITRPEFDTFWTNYEE